MENQTMLQVVQAYDRAPIAEVSTDDGASLEIKMEAAYRVFRDRDGWLKPHERIAILRRLAALVEGKRDHLALQIAREGGKPLRDAVVEVNRAVDVSLSRLNHWLPRGQADSEVMQSTADFHYDI